MIGKSSKEKFIRKVRYKLYPSNKQRRLLDEMLEYHRQLYNAALKERKDAYRIQKKTLNYYDQANQLKEIRKDEDYKKYNAQSQQATLKRLQYGYDKFFQNIKDRKKNPNIPEVGLPRFKSKVKFKSFGFMSHGDGYKLVDNKLSISGIGFIKVRGKSKYKGSPLDCQIIKENGNWFATVAIETEPVRSLTATEYDLIAADWGTKNLLTLAKIADLNNTEEIEYEVINNPKILNQYQEEVADLQAVRDKLRKGLNKRKKLNKVVAKLQNKVKRIRNDFQHKLSNSLANECRAFVTEKLDVRSMVSTENEHLYSRKQQKGLNRNILDTAPYSLFQKIRYKVVETLCEFREIDTKEVKPTQRCAKCWGLVKKDLSERVHICSCGHQQDRDKNAVDVMIKVFNGWEPTMTALAVGNCN